MIDHLQKGMLHRWVSFLTNVWLILNAFLEYLRNLQSLGGNCVCVCVSMWIPLWTASTTITKSNMFFNLRETRFWYTIFQLHISHQKQQKKEQKKGITAARALFFFQMCNIIPFALHSFKKTWPKHIPGRSLPSHCTVHDMTTVCHCVISDLCKSWSYETRVKYVAILRHEYWIGCDGCTKKRYNKP